MYKLILNVKANKGEQVRKFVKDFFSDKDDSLRIMPFANTGDYISNNKSLDIVALHLSSTKLKSFKQKQEKFAVACNDYNKLHKIIISYIALNESRVLEWCGFDVLSEVELSSSQEEKLKILEQELQDTLEKKYLKKEEKLDALIESKAEDLLIKSSKEMLKLDATIQKNKKEIALLLKDKKDLENKLAKSKKWFALLKENIYYFLVGCYYLTIIFPIISVLAKLAMKHKEKELFTQEVLNNLQDKNYYKLVSHQESKHFSNLTPKIRVMVERAVSDFEYQNLIEQSKEIDKQLL